MPDREPGFHAQRGLTHIKTLRSPKPGSRSNTLLWRVPADQRKAGFAFAVAVAVLLTSCNPPPEPTRSPGMTLPGMPGTLEASTIPPMETAIATTTPSGPETTSHAALPYPTALSVENVQQGMSLIIDAPESLTSLAEVQAMLTKHTQLAQTGSLSFDHLAVKYVPGEQRWFLVAVQSDGTTIAGWLQIQDASSETGWRFAEQPTWDPNFRPTQDIYRYSLPELHSPGDHFEITFRNGFPILVEVTANGDPQYWNDVVGKEVREIAGRIVPLTLGMEHVQTIADCNQIAFADLNTKIAELTKASLQYYNDQNFDTEISEFNNHSNGISRNPDFVPWSYAVLRLWVTDPNTLTCSVIHTENGSDMFTMTVPMRAPGSTQVVPMTFAIDNDGMKNWYDSYQSQAAQEAYNRNNSEAVFAQLITAVTLGKPFAFICVPWILSPTTDQPALMGQWEASKTLLDMYNQQDDSAISSLSRMPTPSEIPLLKSSLLLRFFVIDDGSSMYFTPELRQAIADELIKRSPVFPVEMLGVTQQYP